MEPTQKLPYRQFHVACSTLRRIAAIKHIYHHITNDSRPTAASMMTAYYSYCTFPDPIFYKLAQHYLHVEASRQVQTKSSTPKKHLYDALFNILWEIEDISNFFLTALDLEPTDNPNPNWILQHPMHITCAASAPTRPTLTRSAPTRLNPMALEWIPSGSIPIAPASASSAATALALPTPSHLTLALFKE